MSRSHVTAVILSHNALPSLGEVIRAVQAQTHPVEQIIVVDNGSSDGTPAALAENYPGLGLILLPENEGVGAGHNRGWQAALANPACEFIWSLEHDSIPARTCLAELLAAYRQHPDRPQIGAICPSPVAGHAIINGRPAYTWKGRRLVRITDAPPCDYPHFCRSITFNGTLFPAPVIRRVGFLNSDFFLGHEDFDYARRLKQQGWRLLAVPTAAISHDILKTYRVLHLGGRAYLLPHQGVTRSYYSTRNAIFWQAAGQGKIYLAGKIFLKLPFSLLYILLVKDARLRRIQARWRAIIDGLRGSLGRKDYTFLQ